VPPESDAGSSSPFLAGSVSGKDVVVINGMKVVRTGAWRTSK
jgi:hypothetical protein